MIYSFFLLEIYKMRRQAGFLGEEYLDYLRLTI